MRPIEFRLILNGKIVGYEQHENGHIYHQKVGDTLQENVLLRDVPEGTTYIPHDSKDQLTGLKDKNGVKIYDGDILRFNDIPPVCFPDCEVCFDGDVAAYALHSWDHHTHTFFYEMPDLDHVVIGNIHTHPELDKGGE